MIRVVIFDLIVAISHLRDPAGLCLDCGGAGYYRPSRDDLFYLPPLPGQPRMRLLCSMCDGTGGSDLSPACAQAAARRFTQSDTTTTRGRGRKGV